MGQSPKNGGAGFLRFHLFAWCRERFSLLGNPRTDWGKAPANNEPEGKVFAFPSGVVGVTLPRANYSPAGK